MINFKELGAKVDWGKVAGAAGLVLSVGATLLSNKAQNDELKKQAKEAVEEVLKTRQ